MENAIALTITRELGEHDVPVHGVARDASAIAVASRHCRGWTRRPDGLIASWLPDLIARTGARAVLAIAESDLMELATMPPMIGDCHILAPRLDRLARVLDKRQTLEAAAGAGLLTPQTWQPVPGEDFAARLADMRYPLVAKWANPQAILPVLEAAGLEVLVHRVILAVRAVRAVGACGVLAPTGRTNSTTTSGTGTPPSSNM